MDDTGGNPLPVSSRREIKRQIRHAISAAGLDDVVGASARLKRVVLETLADRLSFNWGALKISPAPPLEVVHTCDNCMRKAAREKSR